MKKLLVMAVLSTAFLITGHAGTVYRDRVIPVPTNNPNCMVKLDEHRSVNAYMIIAVNEMSWHWANLPNPEPKRWWNLFYDKTFYQRVPGAEVTVAPNTTYTWPGTFEERRARIAGYVKAVNECGGNLK